MFVLAKVLDSDQLELHVPHEDKEKTNMRSTPTDYVPKPRYFKPTEDRMAKYREWRYGLGDKLYICDFDQVEYAIVDGAIVPVGIIELTLCKTVLEAHSLLEKIWNRLDPDGDGYSHLQSQCMRHVALQYDIPAYVVVHQENGNRFGVRRLDQEDSKWHLLSEERYLRLLHWMRERKGVAL